MSKNRFQYLLILILTIINLIACQKADKISISYKSDSNKFASKELVKYLTQIYPEQEFVIQDNSKAQIKLIIDNSLDTEESFKVISNKNGITISGSDQRGVLYGVYAFLEKKGVSFYISKDNFPKQKKWKNDDYFEIIDSPVIKHRSLFNWHNFLSGCTGWDYKDWKLWIDQGNKMRYNEIMLHAYGNNPMFGFEYLGESKNTGFLNNTNNGRDWGNQHINDVTKIIGGEIFETPEWGASPSFVKDHNKEKEVNAMMTDVFDYAQETGMKVIFSLDFDTWMSNPQNIIKKMPKEAVFEIRGYLTPNPEHPEGIKYYKHLISEFIKKYPQVNELTIWSRTPNNKGNIALGSIWMNFTYDNFPNSWKKEYDNFILQNNFKKNPTSQGMFAFSKVIKTIKKVAHEIKPELTIGYGSWSFKWIPLADKLLPNDIGFRPLDTNNEFDKNNIKDILQKAGNKRDISPIVWAHHDDYAYVGRPFTPYKNLTQLAKERNLNGLGVLHWTTHPLDLYFSNTAKQLWNSTENISINKTIDAFVNHRFGNSELLKNYYSDWITNGPIFGRETSDHFVDLGKRHWKSKSPDWPILIEQAKKRIQTLKNTPKEFKTPYWNYQYEMEHFYVSFFKNQKLFDNAYHAIKKGNNRSAINYLKNSNPEETIQIFTNAHKNIGFSAGEKALVVSLNVRWKADFDDLKQQVGLNPIAIKFSPTLHDPLAQMPGIHTYHIDKENKWWICYGNKELNSNTTLQIDTNGMVLNQKLKIHLQSMHANQLIKGRYKIIIQKNIDDYGTVNIVTNSKSSTSHKLIKGKTNIVLEFQHKGKSEIVFSPINSLIIKNIKIIKQ